MEKNSMLHFKSLSEFRLFYYELDIYNNWRIYKGLLNDRGKMIENRRYVQYFRGLFESKGLFYRKVSLAEIVSWLDSLSLLIRVFELFERMYGTSFSNHISIYVEYMIKLSKRMRLDYVIEYNGKLLVLEFRTVNSFEKIRSTWQKKFSELLIYKELLSNYIIDKEIRLYAFIALYEYNNSGIVKKHVKYNDDQVEYLCKYIREFLIKKL